MTIAVVAVCCALVLAGAVLALRWGHLAVAPPWTATEGEDVGLAERARRFLWWVDLHVLAFMVTGLLVVGPGGRLVMRLLAVTAGERAQGRVTEAEEVVGRITVAGTIGLVIFVGLFGGAILGLAFGLLRKWLPPRRWGALVVALALSVTMATRSDPLRPENPDFAIVGPPWLAVVSFLGLGVLSTLTFAAVAGRLARSLPLVEGSLKGAAPYVPVLFLLPTGIGGPAILAAGTAAVGLQAWPAFRRAWAHPLVVVVGRVALAAAIVVLLPAFVGDLAAIL